MVVQQSVAEELQSDAVIYRSTRRKTSRSREENQQQTQPTYDVESGNRTRATLVEGKRSHHCAIPAPFPLKLEVKPSPDRKVIRLVTLDTLLYHFCFEYKMRCKGLFVSTYF